MKRAILFLLLWPALALGQTVKLPVEVKTQPGRLAAVTVDWDGDSVDYAAPPDLDVFREYDPDPKRVRLRMIGYAAGKHTLFVAVAKAGKLAVATCSIVVGDPQPPVKVTVPNVVGKDPTAAIAAVKAAGLIARLTGDTEGVVVSQIPTAGASVDAGTTVSMAVSAEPVPDDPLTKLLRDAFDRDTTPNKIASGQKLASLYTASADQVKSSTVSTAYAFFQGMRTARKTLIGDEIPLVRIAITKHLDSILPLQVNVPLDTATRELCFKTFREIATALRGCCP